MKKSYWVFLAMIFLWALPAHAVVKYTTQDSVLIENRMFAPSSVEQKQPLFQRIIAKIVAKKINNQSEKNRQVNPMGVVALGLVLGSGVMFAFGLGFGFILLAFGFLLSIISLIFNKKRNNIFGIIALVLGGLALTLLLISLISFVS